MFHRRRALLFFGVIHQISRSHKRQVDDLNPIWIRLLGRSPLSNPSDLPCLLDRNNLFCRFDWGYTYIITSPHIVAPLESSVSCIWQLLQQQRQEITYLSTSPNVSIWRAVSAYIPYCFELCYIIHHHFVSLNQLGILIFLSPLSNDCHQLGVHLAISRSVLYSFTHCKKINKIWSNYLIQVFYSNMHQRGN